MTTNHPSQRILSKPRGNTPYDDLRNVVEELSKALTEVETTDIPSDYQLAELLWLASRTKAEAAGPLAKRLNVEYEDILEAISDPHSDSAEELREPLNNIISGLVEYL